MRLARFSPFPRRRVAFAALAVGLWALAGCQSLASNDNFLGIITPYKVEVVQGNVVTREQAAFVRPGMTRAQVREALGSPLLADAFHANRWDYVFTIRRQGAAPQLRRVVARFNGDTLASIDTGGELPAEREFVASIDTFKTSRNAPSLELTEAQVQALPPVAKTTAPEAEPVGPVRTYPAARSDAMTEALAALNIAVAGASGRMGRMLIDAIGDAPDLRLTGALDRPDSPSLGTDAAAPAGRTSGIRITDDLRAGLAEAQVLIDFTRPEGTLAHLALCRELGVQAVVGTTGFDAAQKALIRGHTERIGIVMAPNMSVGVNVVMKLLEVAARSLDAGYDIEIIESHHRHKVDAPSGTALQMGEVIAAALGRDLSDCAVTGRHGMTGERDPRAIGFSAVRGGDIVGDHTVLFAGTGERIEITHRSGSRATYAAGSLRAARFLAGRAPGLYDMNDVLGL